MRLNGMGGSDASWRIGPHGVRQLTGIIEYIISHKIYNFKYRVSRPSTHKRTHIIRIHSFGIVTLTCNMQTAVQISREIDIRERHAV